MASPDCGVPGLLPGLFRIVPDCSPDCPPRIVLKISDVHFSVPFSVLFLLFSSLTAFGTPLAAGGIARYIAGGSRTM